MQQPREIQFQMPWGHLAGQEWGDPDSPKKVLAIHGWMDNSNSFAKVSQEFPELYLKGVAASFSKSTPSVEKIVKSRCYLH